MTGSWVPGAEGSGFDTDNLAYGVFSRPGTPPRIGARIGEFVLDLAGALGGPEFHAPSLNPFMARGSTAWRSARAKISGLLTDEGGRATAERFLLPLRDVRLHQPVEVADYVDFYCSLEHASNAGRIFRPGREDPLHPNWRHMPVGYHGRSGTVVPSGTDIARPVGQRGEVGTPTPVFGPTERLDLEAELGFVVGTGTSLGRPVSPADFAEHVFGVVLLNDWSARDIQGWESAPLGPFLGKSFATSISPWVVPLDALGAARFAGRPQEPPPPAYLRRSADWGLDVTMEVRINGDVVSRPPYALMYWTPDQMLAHLTSNGSSLRTGDLYASGTVSGPESDQCGSLLELTWNGGRLLRLGDGTTRAFLEDGDTVAITATAPGMAGATLSLGEVSGTVQATP